MSAPKLNTKHTDPCLAKAGDEEPIFVLRAQDCLAPGLVRLWAAMVTREHMEGAPGELPTEKLTAALKTALQMEAWQRANGSKVPD